MGKVLEFTREKKVIKEDKSTEEVYNFEEVIKNNKISKEKQDKKRLNYAQKYASYVKSIKGKEL